MAMTYDRILSASLSAMVKGHHTPHCFSAWVKGRGYTGHGETIKDGDTIVHDRADYLRQLERTAQSEVENMGYAESYCGYSAENQPKRGVLFANWNNLPTRTPDLLEKLGYAIEWNDTVSTCDGCNNVIHTEPSHAFDRPRYSVFDGEILCIDCLQDEHGNPEDYQDEEDNQE